MVKLGRLWNLFYPGQSAMWADLTVFDQSVMLHVNSQCSQMFKFILKLKMCIGISAKLIFNVHLQTHTHTRTHARTHTHTHTHTHKLAIDQTKAEFYISKLIINNALITCLNVQ